MGQFSFFLRKNICCDPILELFYRDSSDEGPQHMFLSRNEKKYLLIILLLNKYLLLFGARKQPEIHLSGSVLYDDMFMTLCQVLLSQIIMLYIITLFWILCYDSQ